MEGGNSKPEELLANLGWVHALARTLVRDPGAADDVAQDTWIAALAHGGDGPPRRWLASVVRNFARQRNRSERSRERRERSRATEEALPSAEELVSRTERQRLVVDAVVRLVEPYRRTVILRYVDGLAPTEIARREGVPAGTVRSRLKRALEKLRTELDGEFGSRRAWTAFLLPLSVPKGLPIAAQAGSGATLAGGSLAMKKALTLVLVLAVLGGGAGVGGGIGADPRAPSPAPEGELAVAPDRPAIEPTATPEGVLDARAPVSTSRSGVEPPAAAPLAPEGWWLTGRVGGIEATGVARIRVRAEGSGGSPTAEGVVGPGGRVLVDLAPIFAHPSALPEELAVVVDHPSYQPQQVVFTVTREERQAGFRPGGKASFPIDVLLVPAAHEVRGHASVPSGCDVARTRVALVRPGAVRAAPLDETTCDAAGRFALRADRPGRFDVVAWQDQGDLPLGHDVPRPALRGVLVEDDPGDVELELTTGESITGTVSGAARGLGLSFVLLARRYGYDAAPFGRLVTCEGRYEYDAVTAVADVDGAFRLTGLGPGTYTLHCSDPLWIGQEVSIAWSEVSIPSTDVVAPSFGLELAWDFGAVLFQVLSGGAPVAEAEVVVRYENGMLTTVTSGDGRVAVLHDSDGDTRDFRFSKAGYAPRTIDADFEALPKGTWIPVELELLGAPGRIVLQIDGDEARTVEQFRVSLALQGEGDEAATGVRAVDVRDVKRFGRELVLTDVPPGRYTLQVQPRRGRRPALDNWVLEQELELEVAAGEELRRTLELVEGGRVRVPAGYFGGEAPLSFRLLDAAGEVLPVVDVAFQDRGWSTRSGSLPRDKESYFMPTLEPGRYTLEVWADDLPTRVFPLVCGSGTTIELPEGEGG